MNQALVVFSGYNERAVVAFLRVAEKHKLNYGIIASSKDDQLFKTVYQDKIVATRNQKELKLEDMLHCLNTAQQILNSDQVLIAPSTEALNRFILANIKKFEEADCLLPLVDLNLYERISDKLSFSVLCQKSDIQIPEEIQSLDNINWPIVAKPKNYRTSNGETPSPFIISSQNEADDFMQSNNSTDFYFQQHIAGQSIYLLYYFYKNGGVLKFSQENLLQQPNGKSIVAAKSTSFHNSLESKKYENLFHSIGFSGLVMVEVKIFDGKNYMIEANPRFWGPSQLFVDADAQLFEGFLFDNGLIHEKPELIQKTESITKYYWHNGYLDAMENGGVVYHNYTEAQYKQELKGWLESDVYNRKDTAGLFKH